LNPFLSFFSNPEKQLQKAWGERAISDFDADVATAYVDQRKEFDDYRFAYETGDFYRFTFEKNGKKAFVELKAQRRKKIIRELVIGKFLVTHAEKEFMLEALSALIRDVKRSANFTLLSIAANNRSPLQIEVIQAMGMRQIEKRIYFIAKGPKADAATDWADWWMFRSDIDTW
jgi:hypothetical protein